MYPVHLPSIRQRLSNLARHELTCPRAGGDPKRLIETLLSDIKFTERESALKQKNEDPKELSCPL